MFAVGRVVFIALGISQASRMNFIWIYFYRDLNGKSKKLYGKGGSFLSRWASRGRLVVIFIWIYFYRDAKGKLKKLYGKGGSFFLAQGISRASRADFYLILFFTATWR